MTKHPCHTTTYMIDRGYATPEEAAQAVLLLDLLKPGLKIKKNGRIETALGEKTPLGLLRMVEGVFEQEDRVRYQGLLYTTHEEEEEER